MSKIFINLPLIVIFLYCGLIQAIEVTSLAPIESLKVKSKYFKEPVEYNVTLPQGYSEKKYQEKKYFILFDLHPRSQPYLSGIHDWLSHNGEWPWFETIVITPSKYNPEFAELFELMVKEPENQTMLDYFEQDLFPSIAQKYRTNGFKIYSGFMSNGAIGLYSLLNRPALFNAYIITSPTLAENFIDINSDAEVKLSNLNKVDNKLRFLYLSTGNHQYEKASLPSFNLFEQALKKFGPQTLDWQVNINNENNYMSRPVVSVINAIEALFDDIHTDLKPDSQTSQKGVEAIIEHYKVLSENKYGFAVSAEGSLKMLAQSYIDNNPQKALTIYRKIAELYSESAYAISALATAYAKTGDLEQAVSYQIQAVEKSKSMIEWHQNKHKRILKDFQQKLKEQNN